MGHTGVFVGGGLAPFVVPVVSPLVAAAGSAAINYIGNRYLNQPKKEKEVLDDSFEVVESEIEIDAELVEKN